MKTDFLLRFIMGKSYIFSPFKSHLENIAQFNHLRNMLHKYYGTDYCTIYSIKKLFVCQNSTFDK